jgi:23S rRNA (pseudouridine1915-N3)-methyltransferase
MLNLKIITIGKIKQKFFAMAVDEYLKRLKPYSKLEITELKSESFSVSNKDKAKQIEGKRIEAILEKCGCQNIFLLSEDGKEYDSLEFFKFLEKNEEAIFVIGGALGFTDELKNKYQKISLSQMTMPHELARVVLLEQIYRAVAIAKGKEYHY